MRKIVHPTGCPQVILHANSPAPVIHKNTVHLRCPHFHVVTKYGLYVHLNTGFVVPQGRKVHVTLSSIFHPSGSQLVLEATPCTYFEGYIPHTSLFLRALTDEPVIIRRGTCLASLTLL